MSGNRTGARQPARRLAVRYRLRARSRRWPSPIGSRPSAGASSVALGGLATLPTHALAELDREAAELAAYALGGGADALRALGAIAHDATRALGATRRAVERPRFARAWLPAALYEDAARRRLDIASW